jgi:methionine-rich copper-binding protein CopC
MTDRDQTRSAAADLLTRTVRIPSTAAASMRKCTPIAFRITLAFLFAVVPSLQPGSSPTTALAACANAIVCENQNPGTPATTWDISGSGDPSIQGFATDISYNKGATVTFKINTPAKNYSITIYRMGYYQGNGARQIATVTPSATLPQAQPACLTDSSTGLVDCGNWALSASWTIPTTAVSGIYFAKLTRTDTKGSSHIQFIVRDDASTSDILFQTDDTTWQAYNQYGGNSLYQGSAPSADGRAYKVSFNRPFATRGQDAGFGPSNFVFYAEYPMVRWLEMNGYDVSYFTDMDDDRRGALIKNHKVFLTAGHDEYWSANQRANVQAARDAGVNLAIFTGNEAFWKIRWENSIDGSGTPYRTMVSYKETKTETQLDPADPPTWTGTWRDGTWSPPADGGKPENALDGTIFMVNRGSSNISVPFAYSKLRLWRNTAVASLQPGQTFTLGNPSQGGTILGYEWDQDLDNGFRPAGTFDVSSTSVNVPELLIDNGNTFVPGTAVHNMTMYRAPSGALVFGAGTVQWSWGLDPNHDNSPDVGPDTPDPVMEQAMVNLLADMSVQPQTLQADLVPASASTVKTPPSSTISAPTAGASLAQGSTVTVKGTATSASGAVVAGVEVSTDGGTTWHPATGTTSWTYTWKPNAPGTATLRSRAVDDSGNLETPGAGTTVNVTARSCPCSIWSASTTPVTADASDGSAIEVGVKFTADVDGTVSGVRFYKGSGNTGTHIGNLWTSGGQLLASATFAGETASGWQQVNFATPVTIHANATYVASYHTSVGNYAADAGAFTSQGVDNYPLHALANGAAGPDGVYTYSSASVFPSQSFGATNYWVDVVFNASTPDTVAPVVSAQAPTANAMQVATNSSISATFSEAVQPSTISLTVQGPSGATIAGTSNYNSASHTITFQPSAALAQATTYTVNLSGAKDLAGNAMTAMTWPFTTAPATSIWTNGPTPAQPNANDSSPVEVGVKFQSSTAGYISGVRFYKGGSNTGTHIGNLWTSGGQLLASATFAAETASGWQQVLFPAPIQISANTTYVASYHSNVGNYSVTAPYFTSAVTSGPLTALQSTSTSGNGLYVYSANTAFPTQSFNSTNYWVDVVFSTVNVDNAPPTVVAQTPAANAANVSPTAGISASFSEAVQAGTINISVKNASNASVAGTVSYNSSTHVATFQPSASLAMGGTYSVSVSGAADLAGNVMAPVTWSFTTPTCPCSLWSNTTTPANPSTVDPSQIEVGVRFQSDIDGYVNGIRFYKGSSNTGTHVGNLWSSTGTLLASATFTNETATGWQQVLFSSPVQVQANTVYVASYHTSGNYAADGGYFSTAVNNGVLHAPASGTGSANGVFVYGASAFPNQSFNATNYWVDVVFNSTFTDTVAPAVTAQSPTPSATKVSTGTAVTATFSKPVQQNTITFTLKDAANTTVASAVTYNSTTRVVTLQPNAVLAQGVTYTASLSGATDQSGNVMTPVTWTFTTVSCPCSIWSATSTPGTADASDSSAIEVGVKFQSDTAGYITGIRFYKGPSNTGTHVGNLWSSTGALLATATFAGETASGWQQVLFSSPVQVQANTTYVASYHTNVGNYAADGGALAVAIDNTPLHALSSSASGGNGVYNYGASSAFPNQTFNATNYWVDVVFKLTLP